MIVTRKIVRPPKKCFVVQRPFDIEACKEAEDVPGAILSGHHSPLMPDTLKSLR